MSCAPETAPATPAEPADAPTLAALGLQAFDQVVMAGGSAYRHRAGQRQMAACVAETFAAASLRVTAGASANASAGTGTAAAGTAPALAEPTSEPIRAIAVIDAGTGVGKSLAYCAPAVALALARGTRVLISTATVALQEQLVDKDLPALAALMPQPFRFALAKGRGRYVCQLKLMRLAGQQASADGSALDDDLFADDDERPPGAASASPEAAQARARWYASLADALQASRWDGERDSLEPPPEAALWQAVAAEARSCTGRHCPSFTGCTYYERRKALVGAQVIVANHDLLLASLGTGLLPAPDSCLLVLDEGHHLPATALAHFATRMDLSRTAWVDKLAQRVLKIGGPLGVTAVQDVPQLAAQLKQALLDLARLVMDLYGPSLQNPSTAAWGAACARVPHGVLPEPLAEPLAQLQATARHYLACVSAVAQALKTQMREQPADARPLTLQYAQIGTLAPRLEAVYATASALLSEGEALPPEAAAASRPDVTKPAPPVKPGGPAPDGAATVTPRHGTDAPAPSGATARCAPLAKWFSCDVQGDYIVVQAHASPILPGATLRQHLWVATRGVVVTSATLMSCGNFDFFLREAGLSANPAVTPLHAASPFDFAAQGRLVIAPTQADPREASRFNAELALALVRDLPAVQHGALVLFTSREQMRVAVQALPAALREGVLVQTEWSRARLLARHRERVHGGAPSIIFGMQSFGEGLDLPGALCEQLFIAKLPFAPPDDPVGQARAEWLRRTGRDPFAELVVPATALRLAQWAGRAIRSETDHATITCYDRRLNTTGYGQRLLQGLPAFTRAVP